MGFFDAFTNIFTGAPGKEAAAATQAYLQGVTAQNRTDTEAARKRAADALALGKTGGLESLKSGINLARGDIGQYLDPSLQALFSGTTAGAGALTDAQWNALQTMGFGVDKATGAYDPLSDLGREYGDIAARSRMMGENAIGLHGPEGNQAAIDAFRASPGYQYAVDESNRQATRGYNAATGGNFQGGNILTELSDRSRNLADQDWQRWLSQLTSREQLYSPLESAATGAAATGIANANLTGGTGGANIITGTGGRLADLYSTGGKGLADIYRGAGTSLADLASKGGFGEAGIYTDTASKESALEQQMQQILSNFGANIAGQYGKAGEMGAQAEMAGSNSLWNLIGGGAKLLAGGGFLPTGSFTPWKV